MFNKIHDLHGGKKIVFNFHFQNLYKKGDYGTYQIC